MRATGWVLGVAMFGMMAAAMGNEVGSLSDWTTATSPGFVGKLLVHLGAVVGAFVGGKLIPTEEK